VRSSPGLAIAMRRRRAVPLVLIAVASLFAFLATFALWANRQLLDTDNWADTSSELLEDEAIRGQISVFLVDQLYANVDVEDRVGDALPPRAQPLAGPAASALRNLAQTAAEELLGRPRAQELWEQANRRAHGRFLQVVEGGGEAVSTEGGEVTLDLKSLLGATQERVGVGGRAEERIPEDAAQLTIMQSDDLDLAQDLVDFLKALAIVLVLLFLGLYSLAVYLARGWRREALRAVGFGLILGCGASLAARSLAGDAVVDSLVATEAARPAVEATWSIGTSLLQEAAAAGLAYGIVIVIAAWLAGPTGPAVATRRALAPYLREPRYAYGALAVLVLVLLAWGPTPATRKAIPALLLVGLLALGVEALRRQTAREFPEASIEESVARIRRRFSRVGGRGGDTEGEARLAELERLAKLRADNVIDDSEFEREKRRILDSEAAAAGP
jgi:Short C-terminal domain